MAEDGTGGNGGERDPQPDVEAWIRSQKEAPPPDLSVIVPAYNEERRLPPTLIEIIDVLDAQRTRYEIIVVDDGSSDGTAEMVKKFERIRPNIRLIKLPKNEGKGSAVRMGMLNARGMRLLFTDADGSSPMEEAVRLHQALDAGADVAIGSRAKRSDGTQIAARWHRVLIGRIFNNLVNLLLLPDIADTQCGFKMFTAKAAHFLFSHQTANGFSFDVELLHIAHRVRMKIEEVPINWHHVSGSKVNLFVDPLKMFRDVVIFAVRHRKMRPEAFNR